MLGIVDALIIGAVLLVLMEIYLLIRKTPLFRNMVFLACGVYIVLVIGVTLFPIHYQVEPMFGQGYAYNFIPFKSIFSSFHDGIRSTLRAVVGNIVMFLPLGILLPLLHRKNNRFWRCLVIIFLCSVTIELSQHLIGLGVGYHYRNVDVDDLILNTLGGVLGWAFYQVIPRAVKEPFEPKSKIE